MNRKLIMMLAFVFVIAFAFGVQAEVKDPIGVVKLRPGEPIHIAYWFVMSGPNTSLGTDTVRGIEIATDTFGGKIKGWPIKISGQDTGCSAEGGQAAATRLAADPTIVGPGGIPVLFRRSNCLCRPDSFIRHAVCTLGIGSNNLDLRWIEFHYLVFVSDPGNYWE